MRGPERLVRRPGILSSSARRMRAISGEGMLKIASFISPAAVLFLGSSCGAGEFGVLNE